MLYIGCKLSICFCSNERINLHVFSKNKSFIGIISRIVREKTECHILIKLYKYNYPLVLNIKENNNYLIV